MDLCYIDYCYIIGNKVPAQQNTSDVLPGNSQNCLHCMLSPRCVPVHFRLARLAVLPDAFVFITAFEALGGNFYLLKPKKRTNKWICCCCCVFFFCFFSLPLAPAPSPPAAAAAAQSCGCGGGGMYVNTIKCVKHMTALKAARNTNSNTLRPRVSKPVNAHNHAPFPVHHVARKSAASQLRMFAAEAASQCKRGFIYADMLAECKIKDAFGGKCRGIGGGGVSELDLQPNEAFFKRGSGESG
jgi:hypothetical protein